MLGFNSKKVYEDEVGGLNKRATDIDFDLGDRFRQAYGMLIGKDYSKEGLLKGAAKYRNQELDDTYGAISKGLNLGPLTPEYKGAAGKTVAELDVAIGKDKNRSAALEQGEATGYLDTNTLSPTASAGAILGATNKGKRTADRKEADEIYERDTDRQNYLLERTDAKEERRDLRASLERAENRKINAETRQMNMQLEYARLAQADKHRAQDKKDRALMALLQGFGNLGAAFTI